jgi:hypothetical protein
MPVEKTLPAKTLDMLIAESKIPNKKGTISDNIQVNLITL